MGRDRGQTISDEQQKPDALTAITADLERDQERRRAHFLPALVLAAVVVVAALVVVNVRPDLLQQPPGQLVVQVLLWILCLVVLPAVGVGLLFPSRTGRILLAVTAVFGTAAATTGWPFATHHGPGSEAGPAFDGCLALVLGTGGLLLAIGFLSGAFLQRRRVTGVFWVAAGVSLVALNVSTWHCPESGLVHVLPSHLGGAALLLLMGVLVGVWSRRRRAQP